VLSLKCPHCQADNSEKAKFCKKCGKPLQTEVVCSQCKHRNTSDSTFCEQCGQPLNNTPVKPAKPSSSSQPTSFTGGRYQVKKFLGEGGKKKVYLAHDITLDRDVAFAMIKTEKLDELVSGHYPFDKINDAITSM
jgi:predicted amidophosphoribosyltransferase